MRILVTGGAGFIGSALVRRILRNTDHVVVVIDKLSYAASLESLAEASRNPRYTFCKVDICDAVAVEGVFTDQRPDAVIHLAAETHVDRSIDHPGNFMQANVFGTYVLLLASRRYWRSLDDDGRQRFRFLHVSTDEVFGSADAGVQFNEYSRYNPSSPYAATKASSDHLAFAWYRTYGLPVLLTYGSNTFGPYQFPEKLIPLMTVRALAGEQLPLYGTGMQIRDWIFVDDHADAILAAFDRGRVGGRYAIASGCERSNIDVVNAICREVDRLVPESPNCPHARLVTFVADRPGHDARYALDAKRTRSELGWLPQTPFEDGLAKSVAWYVTNAAWWRPLLVERYSGERLGLSGVT